MLIRIIPIPVRSNAYHLSDGRYSVLENDSAWFIIDERKARKLTIRLRPRSNPYQIKFLKFDRYDVTPLFCLSKSRHTYPSDFFTVEIGLSRTLERCSGKLDAVARGFASFRKLLLFLD